MNVKLVKTCIAFLSSFLLLLFLVHRGCDARNGDWRQSPSGLVNACMAKIFEVIQPCSERAVSNWNLNHSLFVPSRLSTCCANWEVYDCFIIASLESCSLLEFQALVFNITADALSLQKSNCSRYKYHSETCAMFNGVESRHLTLVFLTLPCFLLFALLQQ